MSGVAIGNADIRARSLALRTLIAIVVGLTAYFLTIQELKSELASKADAAIIHQIDNKLSRLEAHDQQHLLTTAEFQEFRQEIIERLARIESLLEHAEGK